MSGGSFNYLYAKGSDLAPHAGDIEAMAHELHKYRNATEAMIATERVFALGQELVALAESLEDVWQAVEWHRSGDSGEEEVEKALAEFNAHATREPGLVAAYAQAATQMAATLQNMASAAKKGFILR